VDPFLIGIIGILALFLFLAAGVHIGVALGVVGVLGTMATIGLTGSVSLLATTSFHFAINPEFVVMPLFILMGLLAMMGGISEATYSALGKWVGTIRGGLGIATVGACTAFGTVSGSALVTASVFARVSCPEMRRHGYSKGLAYGIVSSAGAIGMLIPPSLLAVVYGLLTLESIGDLLIAGIAPGMLLAFVFTGGILVIAYFNPTAAPAAPYKITWRDRLVSLKDFWPIMLSGAVVIGGIYGGVFTPTEAGAFGALTILLIAVFWGGMHWPQLRTALNETVSITAMIFLILIAAKVFSRFMILSGVAPRMVNAILDIGLTPIGLVIALAILYIILGAFLDSISMLSITIPVFYPAVQAMGIDPMWFAMVVILAIHVGLITPPVGLNVYAVKGVAEPDVTLEDIFRGTMPFFIMMLLALAIIIAFPILSTWLPAQILH
jgi:tripartite ATP-independent transporter DctM subunit